MYYDILDQERKNILPLFGTYKERFYLAGGTALALYYGHRDSIDFDFFTQEDIDTQTLFEKLRDIFKDHTLTKTQEQNNTLSIIVDDHIKISFFTYTYPLLGELVHEEYFYLASEEDIGCMKLSAITGRASSKDYIDLYYLLQKIPLSSLLESARKKFSSLDTNLILKSLVFFDDISHEPILFKEGKDIPFDAVKIFLEDEVKKVQAIN